MNEPKRLIEEEGAGRLGAMLLAARSDLLTEKQVARVRQGVAAALVVGPGVGVAAALVGAKRAWWTPAKIVLAVGAAGLAGGVTLTLLRSEPLANSDPNPRALVTASPPAPTSIPDAPSSVAEVRLDGASAVPEPTNAQVAASARGITNHPRRPIPLRPPPSSTPQNEGALLLEARGALERDPARALALVRAHEQQFPSSQLAPERARIAAEAVRRLPR